MNVMVRSFIVFMVVCVLGGGAVAKISEPPILEYRNLIGTYDLLGAASNKVWNIGEREFIGLQFEADFFPVSAIGVEGKFRALNLGNVPRDERVFKFDRIELVDDGDAFLWFSGDFRGNSFLAFVRISRVEVSEYDEFDVSKYIYKVQKYVLCVPARLSISCAKFSEGL